MEKLNYDVIKKVGYDGYLLKEAPEKVMQFGEGNFLRAFVDYWFDLANEKAGWNGKCCLVQPIAPGLAKMINEQEGLYTLYLRGSEKGEKVDLKRVISSVSRCINPYDDFDAVLELAKSDDLEYIVSNTTEAGIAFDPSCKLTDAPASSYPGKLTQLLYHRFKTFNGDKSKGLIIFPCELIFLNGHKLKETIYQYIELWQLGDEFKTWFEEACGVYATLVDRIVPGFPRKDIAAIKEKLQYDDN